MKFNKDVILWIVFLVFIFLLFGIVIFDFVNQSFQQKISQISGKWTPYFTANIALSPSNNSDPLNLANGTNILFIDMSNPACSNSHTRAQALNPATPWCDGSGAYGDAGSMQPGDTIYFKAGTYKGVQINYSGTASKYIILEPYPADTVYIQPGQIYSGWVPKPGASNISTLAWNFPTFPRLIKRGGYGISGASLADLNNLSVYPSYDFYNYDNAGTITLRLASGRTSDVYVVGADGNDFGFADNGDYVEIKGFNIQYALKGIGTGTPAHLKATGNNINYMFSMGILAGDDTIIDGNNINYTGTPFCYTSNAFYAGGDPAGSITGEHLDHGIYDDMSNVVIKNNTISNSAGNVVEAVGCANAKIYNNKFAGPYGVIISGTGNSFYNNIVYGGAAVYPSQNMSIYNNLFLGDIETTYPQNGLVVKNNIVVNPGHSCLLFDWDQVCAPGDPNCNPGLAQNSDAKLSDYNGLDFSNNIYFCGSDLVYMASNSFFLHDLSDEIASSRNPNFENGSAIVDPQLNLANSQILSTSPAIGVGTCLASFDFYGTARPSINCAIGPFEYSAAVPSPTPPAPSPVAPTANGGGGGAEGVCFHFCLALQKFRLLDLKF